ncbi:MAG: ABC transporter ATP-binding protein [Candidatus Micrarchaeota archaeon]|nr:MAG: ABC transporter ATP-binding protein [Candidatus Micrarchaeota archaeon]
MAKIVLVSDYTLMYNYRDYPLLDFLPCAPYGAVPKPIYEFLKKPLVKALPNGEAMQAPYAIRKLQAALERGFDSKEIVVPHPNYIEKFIDDDTEVIAVSTMDPLGIGPLTMSYAVLFGPEYYVAWVRKEWEALIDRLNKARANRKAKLIVGGPGVWEFTILQEEIENEKIDYLVQGEMEDVAVQLFKGIIEDNIDKSIFYNGYLSYDDNFRPYYKDHPKFITRHPNSKRRFPLLEEIPLIDKPSMRGMTEVMRGCGIGCDFCEVTLRPLRYYPVEWVKKEVEVNVRLTNGQISNAWLHSDEIFAYKHGLFYTPNEEALVELFSTVMSIKGIKRLNPTHGRISIPAAFPDLIKKLSDIIRSGPNNWIGIQVGIETGSDRLAKIHMPNKTLPLRIGPDGSWQEIVWNGTRNFNMYYWRPAFTVQVGQSSETDEDNWDTVALINRLSNSYVNNIPFEFTATPMYNMPLGKIKDKSFSPEMLTEAQLAVYYAAYRHLMKMAVRNARRSNGVAKRSPIANMGLSTILPFGAKLLVWILERFMKKKGVDIEKVKRYGLDDMPLQVRQYGITSEQLLNR